MILHYFVTYRCNLRCNFCELWKLGQWKLGQLKEELTVGELEEHLPIFRELESVVFLGGEPFLKRELVSIVRAFVKKYGSGLGVCFITNGQFPDLIKKTLEEIRSFHSYLSCSVSIDGTKEIHDKIRGREGAFDKAVETLKMLGEMDIWKDLSFTISPLNYYQTYEIFELSKKLGCSFSTRLAHDLDHQTFTRNQLEIIDGQLNRIAEEKEELALEPESFIHAYYLRSIVEVYRTGKRKVPCLAGMNFLILDPYGDMYPCFNSYWCKEGYGNPEMRIGNIKENSFEEIEKRRVEVVKDRLKPWKCNRCWNECDVSSFKVIK